ncbi:hypothetical protein GH769_00250 [Pseudomonas sp. CFSAN084952]|uniref:FUSC family protein n=1 Tax=Pseudomonas TaxID=286 RepID=UPI001299AF0A|nr:FUSC family protein [Pseudomonas sp. CFSAN084952]QGF91723.1 hypothetical protein GH769_00250 [Pseudomonas sp. CFSAN084952]
MKQLPSSSNVVNHRNAAVQQLQFAMSKLDFFSPQWVYIFRSVLAAVLAYAIAYALQLETPYSAANTVLLVTHMNQGVVLAKGGWRLVGTLIGGLVAIVLMGFFIQAPLLFLLSFGLWLGLCSVAATVMRHFWAVGAAVAGYTVGFASYGALEAPEHALNIALGRIATVAVGVVCLGVVTAVLSKRATCARLETAIAQQLSKVGQLLLQQVKGVASGNRYTAVEPDLVSGLFAIDDLLELSRHESPDVSISAGWVRESMASLFSAALGVSEINHAYTEDHPASKQTRSVLCEKLPEVIHLIEHNELPSLECAVSAVSAMRRDVSQIVNEVERNDGDANVLTWLDGLQQILEDWEAAIIGLVKLHRRRPYKSVGFRYNRDWSGGLRNGIRSVLAIVLGGLFGIVTGWHDWSTLLLLLAPYSILLATTGNPVEGAISFVKGTLVGIFPAYFFVTVILPNIQGFPLLMLCMMPFWIAGLLVTTKPKYAFAGLAYLVTFNTLIGATNPMELDLISTSPLVFSIVAFFNKALAWMIAVIATWLAMKLILPNDPHKQAHRLAHALGQDVLETLQKGFVGRRKVWEHLQHHRLAGVALSLKSDPEHASELLSQGLGAIHLGRTALLLHHIIINPASPIEVRVLAQRALHIAQKCLGNEEGAHLLASVQNRILALVDNNPNDTRIIHRTAAAVADVDHLTRRHGGWIANLKGQTSC